MLNRRKSWRTRAGDFLTKYLKLKAAGKAVKGTGKAAKWTAYAKIASEAVQRAPKRWMAVAGGVGAATFAATRRRRGRPTTT